jgi:hypothetical protein
MNVQRTAPVENEAQASLVSTPAQAQGEMQRARAWSRFLSLQGVLWIAGVVGVLAIWLWVVVSFRGMPVDDPYITYRYASNLASGNGYVYNLGERVQSTTTPLFTLILAAGGVVGLDIPDFAYLLNALALLAFGVCCVGLVSTVRGLSPWLGLAAVAMTYLSPVTHFGLGSEMPLLVALAWGSWWAAARDRWGIAALLAGLAAITRGDGVLVGVSIAVFFLATQARKTPPRRWPWHAPVIYLAVVAPWYIFAWLYFGSPFPSTLGTKITQGAVEGAVSFFEGLGYIWTRQLGYEPGWWVPATIFLAVGLASIVWRKPTLIPVWVWALLFGAGYSLLNVPRYLWYYTPLVPVAMLAIVLGGAALAGTIARYALRADGATARGAALAGGLLVAAIFGGFYLAADAKATLPQQRPWLEIYAEAGRWLKANTAQHASVGATEVGIIGYHSQRRMIDFAGLIQPDVAEHAARLDNLWVLEQYKPDYIVEREKSASYITHPWVLERYDVAHIIHWPGSDPVTILKRR